MLLGESQASHRDTIDWPFMVYDAISGVVRTSNGHFNGRQNALPIRVVEKPPIMLSLPPACHFLPFLIGESNDTEDIAAVIAREPRLTEFGIGIYTGLRHPQMMNGEPNSSMIRNACSKAPTFARRFATGWLRREPERPSRKRDSYKWKHVAEREIGEYVSHGAFIAAAIHCGFAYKIERPLSYGSAFRNSRERSRRRNRRPRRAG